MDEEKLSPNQDLNSIKLIRGQRGNYGYEIKLVGQDEKEILKKIKDVDAELKQTYIELNLKEVK